MKSLKSQQQSEDTVQLLIIASSATCYRENNLGLSKCLFSLLGCIYISIDLPILVLV